MAAPQNSQQLLADLFKNLGAITERIGSMSAVIGDMTRHFRDLATQTHRLMASMAVQMGLPPVIRGDLKYLLEGSRRRAGSGGGAAAAGTEGRFPGWAKVSSDRNEYRDEQRRRTLRERAEDAAYFEQVRRHNAEQKRADEEREAARFRLIRLQNQLRNEDDESARKEAEADVVPGLGVPGRPKPTTRNAQGLIAEKRDAEAKRASARTRQLSLELKRSMTGGPLSPEEEGQLEQSRKDQAREEGRLKFNRLAALAAAQHLAEGGARSELPRHNPASQAYRDWVREMAARRNAAAPPSAPPPAPPASPGAEPPRKATPSSTGAGAAGFSFGALGEAVHEVTRIFMGLAAVASGLVQAAAPDVWDTFTGSIKLVAAVVGAQLIPYFLKASAVLQELAFSLEELPQPIQRLLGDLRNHGGQLAELTAALVEVVSELGVFKGSLVVLTGALELSTAGLRAFNWALQKVGGMFGPGPGNQHEYMRQTAAELEKVDVVKETLENAKDQTEAGRTKAVEDRLAGYRDLAKQQHEEEQKALPKWQANLVGAYSKEYYGVKAGDTETRIEILQRYLDVKRGLATPEKEAEKRQGALGLLMAYSAFKGQAQYSDIAGAYKRAQLSALGDDPLTMAIKKIQMDNLAQMQKAMGDDLGADVKELIQAMKNAFGG